MLPCFPMQCSYALPDRDPFNTSTGKSLYSQQHNQQQSTRILKAEHVQYVCCVWQKCRNSELGDAVILDADNNTVTSQYDDLSTLPSDVVSPSPYIHLLWSVRHLESHHSKN